MKKDDKNKTEYFVHTFKSKPKIIKQDIKIIKHDIKSPEEAEAFMNSKEFQDIMNKIHQENMSNIDDTFVVNDDRSYNYTGGPTRVNGKIVNEDGIKFNSGGVFSSFLIFLTLLDDFMKRHKVLFSVIIFLVVFLLPIIFKLIDVLLGV